MTAALLLALLLAQEPPSPADRVRQFIQGDAAESAAARDKLLALGPRAIPALVDARPRAARRAALDDLLFDLKAAAAGELGKPLVDKLRTVRITVDMQNAPVTAVVDYLREVTGLNLLIDPGRGDLATKEVSIKQQNLPLRALLEGLGDKAGFDFDFRYGTLFLAPPDRLWSSAPETPPRPLGDADTKEVRARIAELASDAPRTRDQAALEIRKRGAAALPLLQEAARGGDPEIVARAKDLIADLTPRTGPWKAIPAAAAWRSQKLVGRDAEIAKKLATLEIDLAFENSKPEDILGFMQDFSGLRIDWKAAKPADPITLKVKDLLFGQSLEAFLLPLGLDVKIADGALEIVERK